MSFKKMVKSFNKLTPKDILIFVFLISLTITGYFNLKTNAQIIEHDTIRMNLTKSVLISTKKNLIQLDSLLKNDSTRLILVTTHRKTTDSLVTESMKQNHVIIKNEEEIIKLLTK
jgi:hypothetical protein